MPSWLERKRKCNDQLSKRLLDVKTRYPELEKLALALVVAFRKIMPYFHAHSIEVLTNFPLCQVL